MRPWPSGELTPPKRKRAAVLGCFWAALALLWVGAVLTTNSRLLPEERKQSLFRYCGGKCLCDGGVKNRALMKRVCPVQEDDSEVVQKARREWRKRLEKKRRDQARRERLRREQGLIIPTS